MVLNFGAQDLNIGAEIQQALHLYYFFKTGNLNSGHLNNGQYIVWYLDLNEFIPLQAKQVGM